MTDVSVLMLFFNRADSLQQVFEAVRQAQPARLFLYQDGPRGERDLPGIEACRRVVENIDWPCEVHRLYQEKNYGCDPSGFMSQQWAFALVFPILQGNARPLRKRRAHRHDCGIQH